MSGLTTVAIDTPSAKVLRAVLDDVRSLDQAIFKSQSTHGVEAHSNHREHNYDLRRKAIDRYATCYQRVFEEEKRSMVRLVRINPKLPPTKTRRQLERALRRIGLYAHEYAERSMAEAGFPLPETLGVETAWTRQRAEAQFRKRRRQRARRAAP